MGPSLHLWFCECKRATFGSELQLSMGPRPHVCWFENAEQLAFSILNCTLVYCVPAFICGFVHSKQRLYASELTGIYGTQPSPLVLCMHNSVISTRNTSLHWSQTSPVDLCMQTNVIIIRITSLYWSQTFIIWFIIIQNSGLRDQNCMSLCVPDSHLWFSTLHNSVHYDPELIVVYGSQTFTCSFVHSNLRL